MVILHVAGLLLTGGRAAAGAACRVRDHHIANGVLQALGALRWPGLPLAAGHHEIAGGAQNQEAKESPGKQHVRHSGQLLGCV